LARGGLQQLFEARQKTLPGPIACAKTLEVGGFLLAVNEGNAEVLEGLHEKDEGQLGGVGLGCKHAFAEKHIAQANAIEATNQFFFKEGFNAVRKTQVVQCYIGFLHFLRQPGAALAGPRHGGAGADNVFKAGVDAKPKRGAHEVFFEASGNVEGAGLKHKAWVGAMPQNGGAFDIPGEDALAIGHQQARWTQVPSNGEDTVGGGKLRGGELERVRVQIPIGGKMAQAQRLKAPVKARTWFLGLPKTWR
jgi:hypothetical protein